MKTGFNWCAEKATALGEMKSGEVTLFDLVKTSLRYRPDYIVVGEIRGEEAFVLFQALATGHGGLTTLHADSLDYAVKRLTSRSDECCCNIHPFDQRCGLGGEGSTSNFSC